MSLWFARLFAHPGPGRHNQVMTVQPVATSASDHPIRQIVLLAHGPARATKSAVRRARQLVGDGGLVVAIGADPEARKVVDRLSSTVDAVAATSSLDAAVDLLALLPDQPALLVHDDASATALDLSAGLAAHLTAGSPVVVTGDAMQGGGVCAVIGRPAQLADTLFGGDRQVAIGAVTGVTVATGLRHDGRCGVGPIPDPSPSLVVASLIVRNEAAMLGACLESLEGFVDRVVVCDTGSSDDTVDIALAHGAEVIHQEWRDDFGWARNEALDAVGATDWVLWIDADERLVCPDKSAARLGLRTMSGGARGLAVSVVSERMDAPTSVGTAQRLFRPTGARFDGAIHEEIMDGDTGEALPTRSWDGITLAHLGYALGADAQAAKARRNVKIATAAYERTPTAKTALDLSRSIAYVGEDLSEAVCVAEHGRTLTSPSSGLHLRLESLLAGFYLELEQPDKAYEAAAAVLAVDPHDDTAAAVMARTANGPLQQQKLVERLDTTPADTGSLRVPANRLLALTIGAMAAAGLGYSDPTQRLVDRLEELAVAHPGSWSAVAELWTTPDTEVAHQLIARLTPSSQQLVLTESYRHLSIAEADRLVNKFGLDELPGDNMAEPASFGISLTFGASLLPISATSIADLVPSRRRVLDWTADPTLRDALESRYPRMHRVDPDQPLGPQLAKLARQGVRVDAAVGGLSAEDSAAVLNILHDVLDPAGVAVLWDVDDSGHAITSTALQTGHCLASSHAAERLTAARLVPEPVAPIGITIVRPIFDATTPIADFEIGEPELRVAITSSEPLSPEIALAYRVSVPSDWSVSVEDPTTDADVRLVTDPSLIPDARWVQHLIDRTLDAGTPHGARVVDTHGTSLHAGHVTHDGDPIGRGEPSDALWLRSDRPGIELAPPFAVPGDSTPDDRPVGTLAAAAVALTVKPVEERASVRPADLDVLLASERILFVGGPAPGTGHPDEQATLDKLLGHLATRDVTVLYQWSGTTPPDPWTTQTWRQRGVLVVPPSPEREQLHVYRPDVISPRSDALARLLRPTKIVFLGNSAIRWDFHHLAGEVPTAELIYVGPADDLVADRADRHCGMDELCDVLTASESPRPARIPSIPTITPLESTPGLVSIVIPVHNNWKLTSACLGALRASTDRDLEIIIVDNGSTDETPQGLIDEDVVVVTNPDNRGFPAAVNQGILRSTGEFVCILNNDTEVTQGWLTELLNALDEPQTQLVGPRSNRIAGLQQIPGGPEVEPSSHAWAREWAATRCGRTWRTDRLIGFCLLARRATFEAVGGFDEGFGIGNYEDDELGHRLIAAGGHLRVADGAVVLHHGSATFASLEVDMAAVLRSASRHLEPDGRAIASQTTVVVLSDGAAVDAARTAAAASEVADHVIVIERRSPLSTRLAVSALPGRIVDVITADWTDDAAAFEAVRGVSSDLVLVVGAGELLDVDDWGAARAELEAAAVTVANDGPLGLLTPSGSEIRLIPPTAQGIATVGGPSTANLSTIRVEQPS